MSEDNFKINEIVSNVFVIKGGMFIVSSFILTAIIFTIPQLQNYKLLLYLLMHLCLYEWLFPKWYFLGIENMKYITFLNLINRIVFLVLMFLFIFSEKDFLLLPILQGFCSLLSCFLALYFLFYQKKVKLIVPTIKSLKLYIVSKF